VDIRQSLATSVSPKLVLTKARELAAQVVAAQRDNGLDMDIPVIDKHWLLRWKRDKGVVFRTPNLRFKTSRATLILRLRAMWVNVIKVRHLAFLLLGHDLHDRIVGVDEKPIHFNESGSKRTRTLEIAGAPSVALKENHAATRERVSVMTMVTSDPALASDPARMPVLGDARTRS
jgi:hypothetical protein